MREPKVAWTESYLLKLQTELGDNRAMVCLSPVSYRMLSDLSQMLLWNTRFLDVDYVPDVAKLAYYEFNAPLDCMPTAEGIDMTKEELLDWINEAIEKMTITITNNVGCGCCGAGVSQTASTELESDPLDGSVWTPPDLPDIDWSKVNDAQKCSFANYLVYSLRLTALKAVEHSGTLSELNSFMDGLYDFLGTGGGEVWKVAFKLSYEAYVWVMAKLNGHINAVSLMSEMFDANYNEYVCSLFSASSYQEAKDNLDAKLDSTIADILIRSSLKNISASLPYQLLFSPLGELPLPAGFSNRACCGSSYSVPDVPQFPASSCLPSSLSIVPAMVDFASFDDSQSTFEFNQDTSSGLIDFENYAGSASTFSTPGVLFNFGSPPAGKTRVGWVIEVLENRSNASTVKFAGRLLDGVEIPKVWAQLSLSTYRDCLSSIMDDVFESYADRSTADQTESIKLEIDRARPSSGSNLLSMTFRVWDILETT